MEPTPPSFGARIVFAYVCFFRVLFDAAFAGRLWAVRDAMPELPAPEEKKKKDKEIEPSSPPATKKNDSVAEAKKVAARSDTEKQTLREEGALGALALFQREGRLVDFLKQDITSFGDDEIGAAVRVVHAGCKKTLEEHAAERAVEAVLVAVDGGEAGAGALRWLAHRARMHPLDIRILDVVDTDPISAELESDILLDSVGAVLSDAKSYLAMAAPSAEVTTRMVRGDARREFARSSATADIAVIGSNRTGPITVLGAGSFSTRLVDDSTCPIFVIPKSWRPTRGPVVLGVEGDGSDDAAIRLAVGEARTLHRELRVVHGWELPVQVAPLVMMEGTDAIARKQSGLLDEIVDRIRAAEPDLTVTGVLVESTAASALAREAEGAELLVVGSHHRLGMERFFLGSISRGAVARPVCPVAVVRPSPTDIEAAELAAESRGLAL